MSLWNGSDTRSLKKPWNPFGKFYPWSYNEHSGGTWPNCMQWKRSVWRDPFSTSTVIGGRLYGILDRFGWGYFFNLGFNTMGREFVDTHVPRMLMSVISVMSVMPPSMASWDELPGPMFYLALNGILALLRPYSHFQEVILKKTWMIDQVLYLKYFLGL